MDDRDERDQMESELDPQEVDEHLELKGDALHDGASSEGAGSRFSLGSRATPSPRASLRGQSAASLSRRRGRSDGTPLQRPGSASRAAMGPAGSASPSESVVSSYSSEATPVRSTRSASTAAPSVDPRGDQELLQLMDIGDPQDTASLDLSLASKKTKKSLKSLKSLAEYGDLVELNVANNAVASLDGVDAFVELASLNVSRNHLKRIDAPLFALVDLRSLDLSGNFVSHIPRGIVALEVLEVLNLSGNNLSALKEIDVLGKLANLHTCNFTANPFCKLPTYKDYAVSKLLSLERLDDSMVSDRARDKSRRRFSEEMFSKDKCLREAGIAHASEQTKLREMQLALEAENTKLKDELQLKSKLLQNKSKAWSSATEQLLQLQHDLAMMNLDRRHGANEMASTTQAQEGEEGEVEDDEYPFSNQPDRGRSVSSNAPSTRGPVVHGSRPGSPRKPSVNNTGGQNDRREVSTSPVRLASLDILKGVSASTESKAAFVDAACSPFLQRSCHAEVATNDRASTESRPRAETSLARLSSTRLSGRDVSVHDIGMLSPYDHPSREHNEILLDDLEGADINDDDQHHERQSLRFPTFEDENGCPAYDDPDLVDEVQLRKESRNVGIQDERNSRGSPRSAHSAVLSPMLSPRAYRMWERQRRDLASETLGTPKKSPRRSQVMGLVDRENLVRQIQALQSCKQSFLSDIAKEEQLLHELRRESSSYADQVERLESDVEILIGNANRPGSASLQREEETLRAKLEMLRSKLHYAEDKESEIEATIVRMTKRVLEDDIQYAKEYGRSIAAAHTGAGPFDKEIFALTHNLQMVIVQKEEIHSEMSRLMHQLRTAGLDGSSLQRSTGLSVEALLLIDQQEQIQRVSAENQTIFIEKQKKVEEFKRKLRDVHDRIKIKEDLIASLVAELKDVESELVYINELAPKSAGAHHRRALSLDSQAGSSIDLAETAALASEAESLPRAINGHRGPRKSTTTPNKKSQARSARADTQESISSMVEAAAADVNSEFEQKFKELFSADVLEAIKRDIYNKLSRQFSLPPSATPAVGSAHDQKELHAAIAAALETHMARAVQSFENQRGGDAHREANSVSLSPGSPRKNGSLAVGSHSDGRAGHEDTERNVDEDRNDERQCWDQVDDFVPVPEAKYAATYRFVRERAPAMVSPTANAKCARTAAAQRILKACERLCQVESECKIDAISGIEVDVGGKKKSDLKVLIMGARDLPTSHLRTKNLDPYVALEIIYPDHVLPQAKTSQGSRASGSSRLSQGRLAFVEELTSLPNQSFRSRTVKKSVYPVWDEEFDFSPVHSLKGFLHIRVLNDRKLSREQLVGEVRIPLRMVVDQKKMVESFVLRTSASGSEYGGQSRKISASARKIASSSNASGTIRVQLQLSFSRVERYKRAVDELVTKYFHEHSQLPAFIERVEAYEARLAGTGDGASPDDANTGVSGAESRAETSNGLPTFESWQAQQAAAQSSICEGKAETDAHSNSTPSDSRPDTVSRNEYQNTASLTAPRSAVLWSTPTLSHMAEVSKKQNDELTESSYWKTEATMADPKKSAAGRRTKSAPAQVSSRGNASVSAKVAMAQLRQMVKGANVTPATTTLHNAGAGFSILHNSSGGRRRSLTATAHAAVPKSTSPDCFDDYSPYHPDFQLLDPLGVETAHGGSGGHGSLHHQRMGKARASSYSVGPSCRGSDDDRRTDLRIFKSPGFSRREPSGGFPERFIGLDTQTSERIKRIFGRIDSQG